MGRKFWGLKASGVLLQRESDGKVCLFHRHGTMNSGTWGINGGKIEQGMTAKSSAVNEVEEEAGSMPGGRFTGRTFVWKTPLSEDDFIDGDDSSNPDERRYAKEGEEFTYTTFHYLVTDDEWEPELNWEHDNWEWFGLDDLPNNTIALKDENGKKVMPVDLMLKTLPQRKGKKDKLGESFSDFFVG